MADVIEDKLPAARRLAQVIAASNVQLVQMSVSLGVPEATLWCECGDPTCRERLAISAQEYTLLLEQGRRLLATTHPTAPSGGQEPSEVERLRERVQQLQHALLSRVSIEQAKGVMAERHRLSPDDSFELLRRSARSQRRRLNDVCRDVVDSARTPGQEQVR